MLHSLIMAGGGGTRFWPRSRADSPKQFLTLTGERTLLQSSYDRLEGLVTSENIWLLTANRYTDRVRAQLPALAPDHIVGEPCGRDTAPCIALGAALIARHDSDATMIVTPADHVIEPEQEFRRAAQVAVQMADEHPEALITIGVPPSFPATGYGYIQRGAEMLIRQGIAVFAVQAFKEKPPIEVARAYFSAGDYSWNSGIFIWKAGAILESMKNHCANIFDAAQRIADSWGTSRQDNVFRAEFESLEKVSIDFAVMEKADQVLVLQAPFRWDDVGSWLALDRLHPQDADGNTVQARHAGLQTTDCIIVGDDDLLITTAGVANLLIVKDGDALLVADKSDESAVKSLVATLRERGLENYL